MFLFLTSLHALATFLICLLSFYTLGNFSNSDIPNLITKGLLVYGASIFIVLFIFALYQILYLGIRNVASNEDLRNRWNGAKENEEAAQIYKDKSSCFERANYFLFSESIDSKLQKYCEAVEVYERIQTRRKEKEGSDPEENELMGKEEVEKMEK